jgi:Dna[CI] antecedent, DciA
MNPSGPRRLAELLQSGDISRLGAEAAERRELAGRVRAELAPDVAGHLVSARIDDSGRLVVGMDSAAWAARLRYSRSELFGRPLRVRVAVPGEAPQSASDGAS